MKVKNKIVLGFAFVIGGIVAVSVLNSAMTTIIRNNTSTIFFIELPVSQLASDCSKQLYKIKITSLHLLNIDNIKDFDNNYRQFKAENEFLMKTVDRFSIYLGAESIKTIQIQNIHAYNANFLDTFDNLLAMYKDLIKMSVAGQRGSAAYLAKQKQFDELKQESEVKYDLLSRALTRIEKDYQDIVKNKIKDIEAKQKLFYLTSILVAIVATLIGLAMSFIIFRSIVRPLHVLSEYLKKVSDGKIPWIDMARFNVRDEIGGLAKDVQNMCEGIKFIVADIKESSSNINRSVKSSIKNFEQISEGTCNQSAYLEETSTMVIDLVKSIDDISRFISSSYERSQKMFESAEQGNNAVKNTIQEIYEINNITKLSIQSVESLASASKKINNITEMITNIADQTNMLALNAAIEAARAGDQGKGFAVVSDQVAKLAERSARSAKEIEELIENIQKEIASITVIGEKSAVQVNEGVKRAEESGSALQLIIDNVDHVTRNLEQISSVSKQQVELSNKINEAVQNIAATSEETAAGSENSYNQAQALGVIADKLQDIVKQFEIEEVS